MDRTTVTTKGRFGGFYLEPESGDEAATPGRSIGVVVLDEVHAPNEPPFPLPLSDPGGTVRAGRYRIYLIADGPAQVKIPIDGSGSRRVAVTRPANASALVEQLPVSAVSVEGMQPITLARRSVSLSTILVGRFRGYVGTIGACLAETESTCPGADGAYTGFFVSPIDEVNFSWTVFYKPGAKPAGNYDARQTATNAAGITYGIGATFTLSLV